MDFLCDATLGQLAKWLRILGFDTELEDSSKSDSELIAHAQVESKTLLTRNRRIKALFNDAIFLNGNTSEEQMRDLVKQTKLQLPEGPVPTHCSNCNGKLKCTDEGLPTGVCEGWRCKSCGQLFWEGSHWTGIKEFLEKVKG